MSSEGLTSPPGRRAWLPQAGLLLAVVIWAANNSLSKIILHEASPVLIALVRFTLAGLLFYLPVFFILHRGDQRFARADWPRLILLGAVGVAGSLVFSLLGLRTTPLTEKNATRWIRLAALMRECKLRGVTSE